MFSAVFRPWIYYEVTKVCKRVRFRIKCGIQNSDKLSTEFLSLAIQNVIILWAGDCEHFSFIHSCWNIFSSYIVREWTAVREEYFKKTALKSFLHSTREIADNVLKLTESKGCYRTLCKVVKTKTKSCWGLPRSCHHSTEKRCLITRNSISVWYFATQSMHAFWKCRFPIHRSIVSGYLHWRALNQVFEVDDRRVRHSAFMNKSYPAMNRWCLIVSFLGSSFFRTIFSACGNCSVWQARIWKFYIRMSGIMKQTDTSAACRNRKLATADGVQCGICV